MKYDGRPELGKVWYWGWGGELLNRPYYGLTDKSILLLDSWKNDVQDLRRQYLDNESEYDKLFFSESEAIDWKYNKLTQSVINAERGLVAAKDALAKFRQSFIDKEKP